MRRLLPLALLVVGCAKPESPAPPVVATPAPKMVAVDLTPEAMAKAMDVPPYPGATAPDGLSARPESREDGSTHYSLVLATNDPPEKALAWYARSLELAKMGPSVVGKTKSGFDVIVTAGLEAGRTLIRIKSIAYANK